MPASPVRLGSLVRSELRDGSDQLSGDGLGEREADRALIVTLYGARSLFERLDEVFGGGIERVVLLPPSEIEHRAPASLYAGIW